MTEPKCYQIRTVADFMEVPADRLAECLDEFSRSMLALRAFITASEGTPAFAAAMATLQVTGCEWIDDGARHLSARVEVGDQSVTVPLDPLVDMVDAEAPR